MKDRKDQIETQNILFRQVEFQFGFGPNWLRIGTVLFGACMVVGVLRTIVEYGRLPGIGIGYNAELNRVVGREGIDGALPQLRRAAQIDFDSEKAIQTFLESARAQGTANDDVVWALTKLVRHSPRNPDFRSELITALLDLGRVAEALSHCQVALQLNPYSAKLYCDAGAALLGQKRRAEAAAAYRKALEIDPDIEPARLALEYQLHGF